MVNYFQLYGIQASFHPDAAAVKKKFYELSRQFHPDRFAQAGPEAMDEALRMSAMVNEGYKILKDPDALMHYMLKQQAVLEDEEKYSLPPDFLMEMMELNEAVSAYELEQTEENRRLAVEAWKEQLEVLDGELEKLTKKYDAGEQEGALLSAIKDYYFRRKYLLRVQERIAKFATL